MNKETLRMQMLAGVITESQYKEKLQEGIFQNLLAKLKGNKKPEPVEKSELDGLTDEQAQTLYDEYIERASSIDPRDPTYGGWSTSAQQTANKIKMKYPNIKDISTKNESLNEHYVAGGIVGIGAINQIPSRAKADYEDAFEYFLSQKYSLNEMEDDMPEAPSHEETDAAQVYEESGNENAMAVGNEVEHPEGTGTIELVTDYASYADEIDANLGMDWESMTPKEELTWYKIKGDDGETYWFDEEELSAFN